MAAGPSSSQPGKLHMTKDDEAALDEMARWAFHMPPHKTFPSKLCAYLNTNELVCLPPPKPATFPLQPYQIQLEPLYIDDPKLAKNRKILVKGLPETEEATINPGALPGQDRKLMAYFVRMVPRQKVEPAPPAGAITHRAIRQFTSADTVSLDLLHPPARLVVTVQLQGCSFVIGYDRESKTILHLGHAQPSHGDGGTTHSKELAEHFKKADLNNVFEGKRLSKVKVIGGYGGGGDKIVKVLGWISNKKLFVAIKTAKELIIEEYP